MKNKKASSNVKDWVNIHPDDPVFRKQENIFRRQKNIHRELKKLVEITSK